MNQFVLMADVIQSGEKVPKELMYHFKSVVKTINKKFKDQILSPLTITLGDEFQGVIDSLSTSIQVIIALEEEIIHEGASFKLRYVLHEGQIQTDINRKSAHAMLGIGLTTARKLLNQSKKRSERFHFVVEDRNLTRHANQAFLLYQYFIDSWYDKDITTASSFIKGMKYGEIAKEQGKDDSTLWRKEKSLAMNEYKTCKSLIRELFCE